MPLSRWCLLLLLAVGCAAVQAQEAPSAPPLPQSSSVEDRLRAEILKLRGESAALRQLLAQLQLQLAQRDSQAVEAEAQAFVEDLRTRRQVPAGAVYNWERLEFLPIPPPAPPATSAP